MTDLKKLKVSLTKHGAHKVASLIEQYDLDEVLKNTWGKYLDIKIDRPQARKVVAAPKNGVLPDFWQAAKDEGRPTINSLVLVGIIFSHHKIIQFVSEGIESSGQGTIKRETVINHKAFTNLSDDFKELQFRKKNSISEFSFDMRSIIESERLGPLVSDLLKYKILEAKWNRADDPVDEFIRLKFHKVFGLARSEFREWLAGSTQNLDELHDSLDHDRMDISEFLFKSGHNKRKVGDIVRKGYGVDAKARLKHNDLQNKIFDLLAMQYGAENVSGEQLCGVGAMSIDIVLRNKGKQIFFEIKTSESLRKCIREGVPQLLEYSYWAKANRASDLVIISANKPTSDAKNYLNLLREKFGIPIYHQTVRADTGEFIERI